MDWCLQNLHVKIWCCTSCGDLHKTCILGHVFCLLSHFPIIYLCLWVFYGNPGMSVLLFFFFKLWLLILIDSLLCNHNWAFVHLVDQLVSSRHQQYQWWVCRRSSALLVIISFSMGGIRQQLPEPYIVQINFFQFKLQQTTVKLSYQLNIEWSMVGQHLLRGEAYFSQGRKNKIYACATVSENASIIEVRTFRAVTKYMLAVFSILKRLSVKMLW